MDKLRLQGLTLFPQLGVTEWEKAGVNKVFVDVDLFLDLSVAAREDRVSATVDYSEAYQVLTEVSKSRKFHLIESMAQDLVDALLEKYPQVARVRVRLRKRSLPFDAHLEHVEVTLDRSR